MPAESDENDILASCGAALVPYLWCEESGTGALAETEFYESRGVVLRVEAFSFFATSLLGGDMSLHSFQALGAFRRRSTLWGALRREAVLVVQNSSGQDRRVAVKIPRGVVGLPFAVSRVLLCFAPLPFRVPVTVVDGV